MTPSSVFIESIGIDIDGTITLDPMFFARLSRDIRERGGYVHIVSSRSREGRSESLAECGSMEFRSTNCIFFHQSKMLKIFALTRASIGLIATVG
jgi:hypothetical protein